MSIADVGVGIIMSLANSQFLIFTLLWSVMGAIELRKLLRLLKKNRKDLIANRITKEEFRNIMRTLKVYLTINISYLLIITCQFIYLIYNWDEVNV